MKHETPDQTYMHYAEHHVQTYYCVAKPPGQLEYILNEISLLEEVENCELGQGDALRKRQQKDKPKQFDLGKRKDQKEEGEDQSSWHCEHLHPLQKLDVLNVCHLRSFNAPR